MAKLYEYTYGKDRLIKKEQITIRENNDDFVMVHNKTQEYKHFFNKLSEDRLRKNMIGKIQIQFYMIGSENPEECLCVYFKNELSDLQQQELKLSLETIYNNLEKITSLR